MSRTASGITRQLRWLGFVVIASLAVLAPYAPAAAALELAPGHRGEIASPYPQDRLIVGIEHGHRGEAAELVRRAGAEILSYNQDAPFLVVRSPVASRDAIRQLAARGPVRYVEPDFEVAGADMVPTDPDWHSLWGMQRISMPAAWDTSTGSTEVVVGVIDSGVDYTHPDLATQMWVNEDEDPNTPADDDGNGWLNDVHGADCANNDGDPMDDHSHGTHVAGTIGAAANETGVVGVAWNVRIMALKFLGADNRGFVSDAVECLYYAINNGAHLTNHSWYGTYYSQALYDATAEARDRNQLFVAAAGNESADNDSQPHYPASLDLANVISVAASDSNDGLASFSNYGAESVDLLAPGVGIVSTIPGGYASYSGTSMAAPHVSGTAALLLAADPALHHDAAHLREVLLSEVDEIPALAGSLVTGGRLNAEQAIASVSPVMPATIHVHDLDGRAVDLTRRRWRAIVTVVVTDASEEAIPDVTVTFRWNSGVIKSCMTTSTGMCSIPSARLSKRMHPYATVVVESVVADGASHSAAADHTSESNGALRELRVSW